MNSIKNQFQTTRLIQLLISLMEDLQIRINQKQFTQVQIKVLQANLAQFLPIHWVRLTTASEK